MMRQNIPPELQAWPLTPLDHALAQMLAHRQPSDDVRHYALAALASHQYGRGHACLDLELLAQSGVRYLGWEPGVALGILQDAQTVAAAMPWVQGPASPLVLDQARLYLRRNWQAEQTIATAVAQRLQQPAPLPSRWRQDLDALFPAEPDAATTTNANTTIPDWQKVACALAARSRLTLITGGPGTGKTTTVVKLLALLQATHQGPAALRVALAAPTGKAAARLTESVERALHLLPAGMALSLTDKAVTLHKLLQVRAAHLETPSPMVAADVVIVDEASMIDLEMMARLLAAVPLQASLILLGDKDQLASVEAGAVMAQLCGHAEAGHYQSDTVQWIRAHTGQDIAAWQGSSGHTAMDALAQQTVMLRQSRRFAHDSAIAQWAQAVNRGDDRAVRDLWATTPVEPMTAPVTRVAFAAGPHSSPTQGCIQALVSLCRTAWQPWLELLQALAPLGAAGHAAASGGAGCTDAQAEQILQAYARFQVLCAVRDGPFGVDALNRRIASGLGFAQQGWYAGRPVMVTRNDYPLGLMNGDVGICLPHATGLRVAFARGSGGIHWVLPSRLEAVETVLAMTVHKSQGSEFDHVALVLPPQESPVLTRELVYTGITRARARLSLVVPQESVLLAAVRARVLRSGGLAAHPPEGIQ